MIRVETPRNCPNTDITKSVRATAISFVEKLNDKSGLITHGRTHPWTMESLNLSCFFDLAWIINTQKSGAYECLE